MQNLGRHYLVVRAFYELLRYDFIDRILGFQGILRTLQRTRTRKVQGLTADDVRSALETATCFYIKRVWCLQRSTVLTRLLRQEGLPAELVVGYRHVPFASHSWVELKGRTINDSAVFRSQLQVLLRA